ncbi:hypothetical protein WJX73_007470 [Symbiochloris irregularis]|uniref:Non-structural maintenance of chromosomes element 4 n=1 Tax=Symbiochloris irregularis TaxID=706552 RepID=A0AAW1Q4H3_9CHLO
MTGETRKTRVTDPAASRELRGKILKEHEEARKNKDLLVRPGGKELSKTIHRLDELAQEINRPREQADESDAFAFVSGKGAELARAMGLASQARTPRDCIRRLVAIYCDTEQVGQVADPSEFAWKRLASEVMMLKKHAPGLSCMLGPLQAEAKARKVGQRVERTKVGALERPEVLQAAEEGVRQESDQVLVDLWEQLEKHPVVNLLHLCLNHDSFSQTVENLFQLSFLVRDARVSISDSEEGMVVTNLEDKKKRDKGKDKAHKEALQRLQFVVAYDLADWQDWCACISREDCLMKTRPPPPSQAGATRQRAAAEEAEDNPDARRAAIIRGKRARRS